MPFDSGMRHLWGCVLLALLVGTTPAQVAYYSVPLTELKIIEGDVAAFAELREAWWWTEPEIAAEGGARAFWSLGPNVSEPRWMRADARLVARGEKGVPVVGWIAQRGNGGEISLWRFEIAPDQADPAHERAVLVAERDRYARLLDRGWAGGAWFRHRVAELSEKLGEPPPPRVGRNLDLDFGGDEAFAMFTAGRALAENLQLERAMNVAADEGDAVLLASLPGIDVREFDWKELTAGLKPALDPLARCVPFDQHAFFVPDLVRAARLLREADQNGAPVLQAMEPRCQDEMLLRRYEDQLGVRASELTSLVEGAGSAVLTGSDISFRTGTDVALVIEVKDAARALDQLWQHMAGTAGSAVRADGDHAGSRIHGLVSRDRRVSRYAVALEGAVAISNSKPQLARLIDVHKGTLAPLASLPEYHYFRDRYARGGDESGFAMLTDATIRRWCSARWRIGEHRRIQALARLSHSTAAHAEALARRRVAAAQLVYADDEAWIDNDGARSARWGSLSFCTPVIEMVIDTVTQAEATAYTRWRDGYQRNWTQFFDPIAVRVRIDDDVMAADVSVMPLIAASDYRKGVELSLGARIEPSFPDVHPVLARFDLAINPASRPFKMATSIAASMAPGLDVDPLAWMGQTVGLFVEPDPFWQELGAAESPDTFMEANWYRLPIGFEVEVKSSLRLIAFLAGLRVFLEETAPDMTSWASPEHAGKRYVRIGPSDAGKRELGSEIENAALFYAVSGKRLLLSLNEDLIKRALERESERAAAARDGKPAPDTEAPPLLGENVTLHVSPGGAQALRQVGMGPAQLELQRYSFQNLPILDEWKRLFPDLDPVEVHERIFKVRPICPGGGQYLFNDELGVMESSVYGSPLAPRQGPAFVPIVRRLRAGDFGLTFDKHGLRARAELRIGN